ncbi:MAG: glycosyltransferase family 39 protein [Pirellulales bacterium]
MLITVAVIMRVWRIDSVPGLNGDEAWYGVQAMQWTAAARGDGGAFVWRTPTGNLVNPFFLLPQVAVHTWCGPGVATLRVTAVASGVLALLVNFLLCSRAFDRTTATVSTLLLAVLPQSIAYSRFAWDTSQCVLASVVLVYVSLLAARSQRRRDWWYVATLASLLAVLIVHPTCVFLVPLAAAPFARRWWYSGGDRRSRHYIGKFGPDRLFVATAISLALGVAVLTLSFPPVADRLARPQQVVLFMHRVSRLLSGVTVYQFIPATRLQSVDGPVSLAADVEPYDVAFWALALLLLVATWRWGGLRRQSEETWLMAGLATSLLTFYVVAGPNAIAPHTDRYGMWMIAPIVIIAGRLTALVMQQGERYSAWGRGLVLATAAAMLLGFYTNYLSEFDEDGARGAHRAFRTARVEPKQAALDWIAASSDTPTQVVTTEWWTYWPLRYFASRYPRIEVVGGTLAAVTEDAGAAGGNAIVRNHVVRHLVTGSSLGNERDVAPNADGHTWFVEFDGSQGDRILRSRFSGQGASHQRVVLPDDEGEPLIAVYVPRDAAPPSAPRAMKNVARRRYGR